MIWVLLLPVLLLVPYLGDVLFSPGSNYTDLLISHYPNAVFLRQMILEWRQVPLWSPQILSGYPFAANPLSGLWYPPGWLALLFPLPFGFNLTILLHLLWGGLGMYRWLKLERLGALPALIGAVAFEAMPKIWSHLAAGHLTLIYAVAWTPWLLWMEKRTSSLSHPKNAFLSPGIVIGVIFLADPRWAAYAGLLWLTYAIWQRWQNTKSQHTQGETHQRWFVRLLDVSRNSIAHAGKQILLALLIAAPLIVPLLHYTQLSTRSLLTAEDVFTLSLPPGRLLGLVIPDPGGYAEWTLYPTAGVFVLACVGLMVRPVRRKVGYWWMIVGASLVYSLGSAVPGLSLLANIPGFDLLRVPSRALFLGGIALIVIASTCIDALIDHSRKEWFQSRPSPLLLPFAVFGFVLIFGGLFGFLQGELPFNFLWAILMIGAAFGLTVLLVKSRVRQAILGIVTLFLIFIDAGVINRGAFEPVDPGRLMDRSVQVAAYLASQEGSFRVYSPSYSIDQNVAADWRLSLADGIDPLQLSSYAAFMEKATGVPNSSYSVTLPPFPSGDPEADNADFTPDAARLGLLNVRYVVSEFDLPQSGLILNARIGDSRIYENPKAIGEAWIQPLGSPTGAGAKPFPVQRLGANELEVKADGPGLLVLSEIDYPGWRVFVDGQAEQVVQVDDLLRGVKLETGLHHVRFVYQPWDIPLGIGVGMLAWAGLVGIYIFQRRPHRGLTAVEPPEEEYSQTFEHDLSI